MAVATVRALAQAFDRHLSDHEVNAVGFACEQIAHGSPSGIDNTVATFAKGLLFRKQPHVIVPLLLGQPLTLVVGISGTPGMTLEMVRRVSALRATHQKHLEPLFAEIDAIVLAAQVALAAGDLAALGTLMNLNHGLLCSLGVSSHTLDAMVHLARQHGALGAKLTGGGGGGAMIALCDGNHGKIAHAMQAGGYAARTITIF